MVEVNHDNIIAEWRRSRQAHHAAQLLVEAGLYADAISRTYYAILHAVTAALLNKGFYPNTHPAAGRLLNQHFIHTGEMSREWLDYFQRAMNNRRCADYNVLAVFTDQQAEQHLQQAEAFRALIHRYLLAEGFSDAELAASQP